MAFIDGPCGRKITLLVMTVALVSGCSVTATSGVGASAPSADPVTATGAPPSAFDFDKPIPLLSAEDARSATVSTAWTLLGMSEDQKLLFLQYNSGNRGCLAFEGLEVAEKSDAVTITALSSPGGAANCDSAQLISRGYVELRQPLGQRRLRHDTLS